MGGVSRRGWVLFVAMGLIWGIPYLLIKVAVGELTPASLVFVRTALATLLLLPMLAGGGQLNALVAAWKPIVAYTLIEVTVPWFLLSDAERRLSSSLTGLLVAAVPLVGIVIARAIGADKILDGRRLVGLLLGFVGVAVLLGLDVSANDFGAVVEMGLVVLCYAIGPLIIARKLSGIPSGGVVAASLAITALIYAPVAFAQLPDTLPPVSVLGAVAVLGVVCTALAFLVFFALIAEVGPVRAQMITYVNPAVALALGVLILGEPFTLGAAIGFGLIVLGLALATRPQPQAEPRPRILVQAASRFFTSVAGARGRRSRRTWAR
jgi:drug/metabolite transporter (DMT)-like permease